MLHKLLFTTIFLQTAMAQIDTTRREFYPLHIGDLWQYRNESQQLRIQRVIGDTIIEGKHYFLLFGGGLRTSGGIMRVDTLMRVELYSGTPADPCVIYKLAEPESTVWQSCYSFWGLPSPTPLVRFDGIFLRSVFGQVRETMDFSFGGVIESGDTLLGYGATLVRGIGVYREQYYDSPFFQLYGAIINGDTLGTVVSVVESSDQLPVKMALRQNYPNPFNASTIIRYEVPNRDFVSLKVYNMLGQEIIQLVNGFQESGIHQATFEAQGLTSGVYFYQLRAAEKVLTRFMVLLR